MPARLRVTLNEESDRTLQELPVAIKVSQHIKDRAHMVRLNAQGWNVPAIAEIFECQEQTVRLTLSTVGARGIRLVIGRARTRGKTEVERGRPSVSGGAPQPRPTHLQ